MAEMTAHQEMVGETTAPEPVVVREHQPTIREMVRRTWEYRDLILPLGTRRIVKGFAGTYLGRYWLILRPLISIFGMALIFGSVLKAPSNGVPYLLFLMCSMVGWMVIERTVYWSVRSVDIFYKIVGTLNLPVMLAPAAGLALVLVDVCVVAALATGVAIYYTVTEGALAIEIGPSNLIAVAGMALGLALAFGVGLVVATLNGLARDVWLMVPFTLRIWMFMTPVIYSVEALPERWHVLATINPAAAPVEMVKEGLLGIGHITALQVSTSIVATVGFLLLGAWFMTWRSPTLLRIAPILDDEEDG